MNSRDLTLTAIDGVPERVPFNPFIMHLAATIDDIDYSNVYCQDAQVLAESQIRLAKAFGIDHVHVSTDAYREASAWGVEVDFSSHTPIAKAHLSVENFDSTEDPDLNSSTRVQDRIEAVKLLSEQVGKEQCVVGWIEAPFAEVCCLFGLMDVMKMARHSDWSDRIRKIIDRVLPVQLDFAKMQIEAGADIIGAGDSAVSQIGPKRYESACFTQTQDLFGSISLQAPVLYHVCGNSSVIDGDGRDLLKLVASSGASILDVDCQVDMKQAKKKVGEKVCLRGNTDTTLLGSVTFAQEEIEKNVAQVIKDGKPGGRYMYSGGCEWPWQPLDLVKRNLRTTKSIVEKLGSY
ncbi:MAG: uroporphyrinogen decarboxylase family protein [Candidatus Thorarchaeota archaeon]